jgi:hypothetical protein
MAGRYQGDGYDRDMFVRGVPRLYGDLRFTCRCVLHEDAIAFFDRHKLVPAVEYERKSAEFVASAMSAWDRTDRSGAAVPLTGAALLACPPPLWRRIFSIVFGNEPPDEDPREPAAAEPLAGRDQEASDEKNS